MTTTELLALFRSEVFDLELPYLWSDDLIYSYIDEAQKQFCRDTYGIADARSFTLSILADGTEWYKIDPRILKTRDAIDVTSGNPVQIVPIEKMTENNMKFDGGAGPLKALISGLEDYTYRAWPVPNTASTVSLRTFRLPNDVVAGDDLEVNPQHHRYLLYWVKHLAYDVQDTEVYDPKASEKYKARHVEYCAKAKNEMSRAMHPVGTVIYGGI
jgi:hypothetical protein